MIRVVALFVLLAAALLPVSLDDGDGDEPRWWRGNTHTHTLWSDGDGAPELVVDWYASNGYDFLVLSDHNVLSRGERWFGVAADGRLTTERVAALRERFGADAVETRERDGRTEMRLATLSELRERFESPGAFLLIEGEEITDGFDGRLPVHVNALNLAELVEPQGGASVVEVMQRNIDAVIEQSRRLGRPMLAHVNHPNFYWGITPEELAQVRGERFFEVYNGHPSVRNEGDAEHPSLERAWDVALTLRLTELDLGLLYGLATDDAHAYHAAGDARAGKATAGRGWVWVRAPSLAADAIVEAMRAGDFYSSSGVRLADVAFDGATLAVDVAPDEGARHVTRFIGTRRAPDGTLGPLGEVLAEVEGERARYRLRGDELYVRAVVESSREHPNPYRAGEREKAWVQPVRATDGR